MEWCISFGVQLASLVEKSKIVSFQPDLVLDLVLVCYLMGVLCDPADGLDVSPLDL